MDGLRSAFVFISTLVAAAGVAAGEPRWQFVELTDAALPAAERPAKRTLIRWVDEPEFVRLQSVVDPSDGYRQTAVVPTPESPVRLATRDQSESEPLRIVPNETAKPTLVGSARLSSDAPPASSTVNFPPASIHPVSPHRPAEPPIGKIFVMGEVCAPGELTYRQPMTAVQAIASAGGARPTGKLDQIAVLRYRRTGDTPRICTVDLQRTLAGHGRRDFWLQPGDVVVVPKKPIAKVTELVELYLYGFLPSARHGGQVSVYRCGTGGEN
jgi:polysaccharide export outer membrane protein